MASIPFNSTIRFKSGTKAYALDDFLIEIHHTGSENPIYKRPWLADFKQKIKLVSVISNDRVIALNNNGDIVIIDGVTGEIFDRFYISDRSDVLINDLIHVRGVAISPDKTKMAVTFECDTRDILVVYDIDRETVKVYRPTGRLYGLNDLFFIAPDQVFVWGNTSLEEIDGDLYKSSEFLSPISFLMFNLTDGSERKGNVLSAIDRAGEGRFVLNHNGVVAFFNLARFDKKTVDDQVVYGLPMTIYDFKKNCVMFDDPVHWLSAKAIAGFVYEDEEDVIEILNNLCEIRRSQRWQCLEQIPDTELVKKISEETYDMAEYMVGIISAMALSEDQKVAWVFAKPGVLNRINLEHHSCQSFRIPELLGVRSNTITLDVVGNDTLILNSVDDCYSEIDRSGSMEINLNEIDGQSELIPAFAIKVNKPHVLFSDSVRLFESSEAKEAIIKRQSEMPIPFFGISDSSCSTAIEALIDIINNDRQKVVYNNIPRFHFVDENGGVVKQKDFFKVITNNQYKKTQKSIKTLMGAVIKQAVDERLDSTISYSCYDTDYVRGFRYAAEAMAFSGQSSFGDYLDYMVVSDCCGYNCAMVVPEIFRYYEWDMDLIDLAVGVIVRRFIYGESAFDIYKYRPLWHEDGLKEAVRDTLGAEDFAKKFAFESSRYTNNEAEEKEDQADVAGDLNRILRAGDPFDIEVREALIKCCHLPLES